MFGVKYISVVLMVGLAASTKPMARAATMAQEEVRDGERFLVLENEFARIVVWPAAGGAITEFVDKRSGHDYVTKGVRKGRVGPGLKDVSKVGDHETCPPDECVGTHPFDGELRKGDGYQAIVVTCRLAHLFVEREMRLEDDQTTLTVLDRHRNQSDQPQTIWLRFHPYMRLADTVQSRSTILVPGPDPDVIRSVACMPHVASHREGYFMDVPGYWLMANPDTGAGMWMTFAAHNIMVNSVWTTKKDSMGELFPHPRVVAPGDAVELRCTFQPIVATDRNDALTRAFIPKSAHDRVATFLHRVRSNLEVVATHTMVAKPGWPTPKPSAKNPGTAEQQNCFAFMHRRRDRFALRDWGIADAMMAVPGVQSKSIRTRLYARTFAAANATVMLTYELTVADMLGKVVKQSSWQRTLGGQTEHDLVDERQDVPLSDLPDGRYTFALQVREGNAVIHRCEEQHKLVGAARAAASAARLKAEVNVPLVARERVFVKALRQVEIADVTGPQWQLPIGVEEASGLARKDWPLRVGVPFAPGVMSPNQTVKMRTPTGDETPIQRHTMGTWPDGSIKWLLVDFQADVAANSHVFYTLQFAATPSPQLPNLATVDGETVHVNTGVAEWTFRPDDSLLLGLFEGDGLWWKAADGRDYRLELRGEGAGIRVLENGPLRTVVEAVGWYVPPAGTSTAKPIARGQLRAEFYRGKAWYRLHHTFTFTGNPWRDALASTGIRFSHLLRDAAAAEIDRDGETVRLAATLSLWQPDEDHALIRSEDAKVSEGHRSSGAAALANDQKRVVVYHRHLWEMFPKRVTVAPKTGQVAFDYWPQQAGVLDWRPNEDTWHSSSPAPQQLAVGVSRTHQFVIDPSGAYRPHEYQRAFDEPVIAVVPPRYLCGTGALPHLQPYDPSKIPELENRISEAIDSYQLHREVYGWYGQWDFGTIHNRFEEDLQRWAIFGRYANLMNEQDILHFPWLAYLRSGDRKYRRFAELSTRHLMDVGTIRWNDTFPNSVGMSRRHHHCVWLSGPDYGHSMLDPFLELYHVTGDLAAWEAAERMAQAMAKQRSGIARYLSNPTNGLARMYLETQRPFYKEEANRLWRDLCVPDRNAWFSHDHGSRMAFNYSQINDECKRLMREMADAKKAFHNLDTLAALHHDTGDAKYARWAAKLFREKMDNCQAYDQQRQDPMFWTAAMHTQHVLAALREAVYASAVLEAAKQ